MYYHVCEHCKAALDPGEKCDCTLDREQGKTKEKKPENKYNRPKQEQRLARRN